MLKLSYSKKNCLNLNQNNYKPNRHLWPNKFGSVLDKMQEWQSIVIPNKNGTLFNLKPFKAKKTRSQS